MFLLLSLLVASLAQSPPVPSLCTSYAPPISKSRLAQLLGPGGVGPVQIANVSAFGSAYQLCNAVSGCTPWTTQLGSSPNGWLYTWSGNMAFYASCDYVPSLVLAVQNGTTAVVGTSLRGTFPTFIGTGLGSYGFSTQLAAINSDCQTVAPLSTGPNAATASPITVQGYLTDDCVQLHSPIMQFQLPSGQEVSIIYWYVGGIGTNVSREPVQKMKIA